MLSGYVREIHGYGIRVPRLLFRGITQTMYGSKLREKGGLSYTTLREAVLAKLEAIGLDERQYDLHSLRAGGASLTAVKACLTSLGTRPSASQLVACTVTSLPYKLCTSHGKKLHRQSQF